MSDNTAAPGAKPPRRWGLEIVGEIVLLAMVGSFFVYLFVKSLGWPLGAALMPRIVVIIGIPFLILRVVALLRQSDRPSGDIMDMGFRIGDDPTGERHRFIRFSLYIVGLYLAIWIFGFHVALPLGMAFYVRVYGKMSWVGTLIVGASFFAVIVLVYDQLLHATWHEPLIVKAWDRLWP
jgi:hypothetical protein